MPHREALSTLDEWKSLNLDKALFQKPLHHLGGSFEEFYKFVSEKVSSFKPLQCNQLLLDRMKFVLGKIHGGESTHSSNLKRLIEKSFTAIPCKDYPQCHGHKFDPNCKHRK